MRLEIIHSDKDTAEERYEAVKYWSNACGELHYHGKYDITEEELPAPLYDGYMRLWSDSYGSLCYLVETQDGYGVALINEYHESQAKELGISMKELFKLCVSDAIAIMKSTLFDDAHIYVLEESGVDECHELIVVFPTDTDYYDEFKPAANALYQEFAYRSLKELEESRKQKYYVTIKVDARFTAAMFANSLEEAKVQANLDFMDADIGDLEFVGTDIVSVEDEAGKYLYEK